MIKENYRKGAHVMYECGTRLGTELCTLAARLKKQVQSYLAAINSLKLVSERYQWIVRPGHPKKNLQFIVKNGIVNLVK